MLRPLPLAALAALVLFPACTTHTVRQSTLFAVPSAGPPQTSHGRADVFVGGSGSTFVDTHSRAPSDTSGTWLAQGQLDGQVAVRIHRVVSVRMSGFLAIPEGAVAPDPTTLERPPQVAFGVGPIVSLGHAAEDDPYFGRVEVGVLVGSFPSVLLVESTSWLGECSFGCTTRREEHYGIMPVLHGGLTAGYWVTDFLALSGGVVLRNQPRNAFRDDFGLVGGTEARIDFGDLAGIPWLAAELELDHTVGIVAQVQLPILADQLFGPTLSIGVRGIIGPGPQTAATMSEPE